MKGKQTYIEWSGFHWAKYFLVNESRSKWLGAIALDEPTLREVARAPGACLLSAPSDSW
jgi:hypothetical protein